jgi:hypothetical protein
MCGGVEDLQVGWWTILNSRVSAVCLLGVFNYWERSKLDDKQSKICTE